jgi:hypothetical protein
MELARTIQRKPYNAGMPVRGEQFYGRSELINNILDGPDRAIWVVSNRRIGKTSLLYRLTEVANDSGQAAFYIAMDAADTLERLSTCFLEDLDDGDPRLERLGLKLADLQGKTPVEIIRAFDRGGREHACEVVLLLDEAEGLIQITQDEIAQDETTQFLKDLQHVFQGAQALRVVLAATKRLLELDEYCKSWNTSRFLDPFALYYLGSLEQAEALDLVHQSQAPAPQLIDNAVAAAIVDETGGHPYLMQSLAFALWEDGVVRAPTHNDLLPAPGGQWSRMFQQDYDCLSSNERRILLGFAAAESLSEAEVATLLGEGARPEQVHSLLSALAQLCYVRPAGEHYRIGNTMLRNWLRSGQVQEPAPAVSNAIAEDMANEEQQALTTQIDTWERRQWALQERQAQQGISTPPEVTIEIADITTKLGELKSELNRLRRR